MKVLYKVSTAKLFMLALLIFSIGFVSSILKIKLEIKLGDLLTVLGWFIAIIGAWYVAQRQLIIRHQSDAVTSLMESNRLFTVPLSKLARIVGFGETKYYYSSDNYMQVEKDLGEIHDEIRNLLVDRAQRWEEHRIKVMPTEVEYHFVMYYLQEMRDTLFQTVTEIHKVVEGLQLNQNTDITSLYESQLRFSELLNFYVDSTVFLLDYGNHIQNKYFSAIFKDLIPRRMPLVKTHTMFDYDVDKLTKEYQKQRDAYFLGNQQTLPSFSVLMPGFIRKI